MFFPFSFFPDSSTEVGIEVYLQSNTLGKSDFIFKVRFTKVQFTYSKIPIL